MLKLGEKIIVIADQFEQELPIGEYGYVIAYERNEDSAFDYVIRVPKENKHYAVPFEDIESEAFVIEQEADQIEKDSLIDYALRTRNKELFEQLVGKDEQEKEEAQESTSKMPVSAKEFIRQINLRAWI